jgi:hypothetical protein
VAYWQSAQTTPLSRQFSIAHCCLSLLQAYMEYMPITTPSGATTSNSSSSSSGSNTICGGLADIYRAFTFGSTMTLVRQSNFAFVVTIFAMPGHSACTMCTGLLQHAIANST